MTIGLDYTLSEEQIAFFKENGYLQVHDLFSPEQVEHIKATMLEAMDLHQKKQQELQAKAEQAEVDEQARIDAEKYAKVFRQQVNLWTVSDKMKEITFDPTMAEMARQLGGFEGVQLWHDQALVKPGGDSRPSNWHQDTVYWPMNQAGGLSIWIALDDVDDNNGCMWFVPRSRDIGPVDMVILSEDDPEALLKRPELEGKLAEPVCMAMKAGSVTFHDGLTFHYANANKTPNPRHAFVVIYMPEGTTYNGKGHICTDDAGLTVGGSIAGENFPVLAGPNRTVKV